MGKTKIKNARLRKRKVSTPRGKPDKPTYDIIVGNEVRGRAVGYDRGKSIVNKINKNSTSEQIVKPTLKFKGKQLYAGYETLPFNKGLEGYATERRITGNFDSPKKVVNRLNQIQNKNNNFENIRIVKKKG